MRIVLVGYRGSGKTTLAKALASHLSWEWVDSDVEVERRSGKTIAAIFNDDGVEAFRDLETQVLLEFSLAQQLVLATGGGAVLRNGNHQFLTRNALVVWLQATPETLHRRISGDATTGDRRPALTTAGGTLDEVRQVLSAREPLYACLAQLTLDTERLSKAELVSQVLAQLRERESSNKS